MIAEAVGGELVHLALEDGVADHPAEELDQFLGGIAQVEDDGLAPVDRLDDLVEEPAGVARVVAAEGDQLAVSAHERAGAGARFAQDRQHRLGRFVEVFPSGAAPELLQ